MGFLNNSGLQTLWNNITTNFQEKLVSGTNIKTINNSTILGSGDLTVSASLPTASTSTLGGVKVDGTTIDIDGNGVISFSGIGIEHLITTTATLTVAGWSSNSQTVNVSGVTSSNAVIVTYAPESRSAYVAADIYCSAQGSGTLTFVCTTTPSVSITVNIIVMSVNLPAANGESF